MQLSYELTPEDLQAAQFLYWRRRRTLFFWGFTLYGVLSLLFGLWQLMRGSVGGAFVPLVFGVWATLYVPVLIPRAAKKTWTKSRLLHGPTTFTTSNEGLEVGNPMSRGFTRWEVMGGVVEGPKVWLVFIGPLSYYVVPVRALGSEEERVRLRCELHRAGTTPPPTGAPIAAP